MPHDPPEVPARPPRADSEVDGLRARVALLEELLAGRDRELYRAIPSALIVFDRNGIIETVNDAALALLGYREEELIGMPVAMVIEPVDVPDLAEIEAPLQRGEVLHAEKTFVDRSGGTIPVLFSASLLAAPDGVGPSSIVCVAKDIRDRRRLEVDLRQAQKLHSVGRLAAGVAHELNTPVQFVGDNLIFLQEAMEEITGLLEAHREVSALVLSGEDARAAAERATASESEADFDYLREHLRPALTSALQGLGRMAGIVQSMKEFAQPDRTEKHPVDLNAAILSTLRIAAGQYTEVADVETDLGELPLVTCHVGDINEAVLNLVVNAGQAIARCARDGARGHIVIQTRLEQSDAVIRVTDDGGGIHPEIQPFIFDPFFTTQEVGQGTGQGLALARSLVVDKHGGTVTFETEVGTGTTFVVRLPVGPGLPGQ